ncbi:MAG: hypothetical protein JWO36_6559 [Myxococcales bacterium]|nr:hypothetical protein [Myxococcales bacterium]
MTWILIALILVLVADSLRMRGRLTSIATLEPTEQVAGDHQIVAAPGVTVTDSTRRSASAWAVAQGLDVVDLVPRDLPAIRAMSFAQLVDPAKYRKDRLGPGRTAGHAILVTTDVATRAQIKPPADEVEFVRLAARLKHFGRADVVVAPDEHARPFDLGRRFEILRVLLGPTTPAALVVLPVFWTIIGLGVWLRPIPGLVALAIWHLQPLIAIAGTKIRSRDVVIVTLLRAPIELWMLVRTIFGHRDPADPVEARRAEYDRLIAGGTAGFFEARRQTCPVCDGRDLVVHLRNSDLMQHKPGVFTLERCRGCSHVFQNPRLSFAGLDYYYKDFYDGLGEAGMEFMFGFGAEPYYARARMMREIVATPARWLDVGCGHGHFCIAARDELPGTSFDGLDMSESIDEATRRRWVDTGYRGLFPELAPQFAGKYDAVSMSHYLEHTLDPRVEIKAAHTALATNGHLMIEVPDPEFKLGRWLGRYWLPWFQPQHLNLLSVSNLERLLREGGFTPITWHRGQAHQRVDFFFAAWLVLNRLAPPRKLPWRWRGAGATAWRVVVWTLGSPLLVAGLIVDNVAGPLVFQRGRVSNTYRVVARRGERTS